MKNIFFILFLSCVLASSATAELSIIWENLYTVEPTASLYPKTLELASGNILVCYAAEATNNSLYMHKMVLNHSGDIVSTERLEPPLTAPVQDAVAGTVSGGALIVYYSDNQYIVNRLDHTGDITETLSFQRPDNQYIYRVSAQEPDNSVMFCGGYDTDIIKLNADQTISWSHDFSPPYDYDGTHLYFIGRLHDGRYFAGIEASNYSQFTHYGRRFTAAGHFFPQDLYFTGSLGMIAPDENAILSFTNNRSYLRYSGPPTNWQVQLGENGTPFDYEQFFGLADMNAIPGYICAGYRWIQNDYSYDELIVEVSATGQEVDVLENGDGRYTRAVALLDGSTLCIGYRENLQNEDELLVTRVENGNTHLPVRVGMWIYDAPRQVSAQGGVIHYRTLTGNALDEASEIVFQMSLEMPNGAENLLWERPRVLQPQEPLILPQLQQHIPGLLPAGQYALILRAFDENGSLLSKSFQTFVKAATGNFLSVEDGNHPPQPDSIMLMDPYPNPFNASTTISVTLPETAALTVRVFDIQGRTVSTLADGGSVTAGSHAFSFDGSNLSSGIYFVQATVPGQLNEVRKLMLVK